MRRRLLPALVALAALASPCLALEIKSGSTATKVNFVMLSSTDHVTPVAGLTPTVTISKNGGAFAAPTGTVAEVANGWYALTPSAADTGTTGDLILHATGTGADPADRVAEVVAYDPTSATNLGLSTLAGNTPQTGDAFARIGTAGAGLTTLGDGRLANLDAAVSTRLATAGYTAPTTPPPASAIATAVRDVDNTAPAANSLGAKVNSAASAGDPWATNLPGAYASGSAGNLLGNRLDAAVSTRSTYAGADTAGTATLLTRLTQAVLFDGSGNVKGAPQTPVLLSPGTGTGQILLASGQVTSTNGGGGGASFIPAGAVVAGSTTSSVTVSGLPAGRAFVGQHLYHQSGESRLIGAQSVAGSNYVFTFQATALLPAAFSAISAGDVVKPTP